jgi:uncharacterized protein (DUF697 family)
VPRIGDIGGVWSTIRELNVSEIREEAEAPVTIAIGGDEVARQGVISIVRGAPGRFPAAGRDALLQFDLPLRGEQHAALRSATLIVLAIDGRNTAPADLRRTADQLALAGAPICVICLGSARLPPAENGQPPALGPLPVTFVQDTPGEAMAREALRALVERIPAEQRVAAARRLPGLRDAVAREVVGDASFSNATYALTSGLPELIPLLNIPLNAADLLVLTKNQALMAYRIALAYGAPGDFQAQMRELLPVVGGGFLWRQVARQLVGLLPGFGLVPKVVVAYAGTYATGQAAALWYGKGEVLSRSGLRALYKQALTIGKERTRDLISRRRRNGAQTDGTQPQPRRGLRRFLPGPKEPPAPPEK